MPVYDIAANRTYASPIRSYYQGKALRADTTLREKQADALQMEIDSAPDRAAAAQRKEQRETEEHQWAREKAEEARVQAQREGWEHIYDATGKAAGVAVRTEDEDGGYEAFFQTLETLVEPEAAAAIREKVDPDGNRVFGPKELVEVNALAEVGGYGEEGVDPYAKLNPKDFTSQSWAAGEKARAAGDPNWRSLLMAKPTAPVVSINMAGEGEATKKYAGSVGERAGERSEQAMATFSNDAELSRLELALSRGARTGFGESVILDIRSALDTFGGINFSEGAQETEVVRSIGNKLALMLRNPQSGLGLTGNTSNKDLQFLKDSVAGISRSEGGNRLLIKQAKKLNQFKRDIVIEQDRIIEEAGNTVPLNLDRQILEYANSYQFFTEQEKKEIRDAMRAPAQTSSPQDVSDDEVLRTLGLSKQ